MIYWTKNPFVEIVLKDYRFSHFRSPCAISPVLLIEVSLIKVTSIFRSINHETISMQREKDKFLKFAKITEHSVRIGHRQQIMSRPNV